MKKQVWMISVIALSLALSQSYPIQAESFEGREDEMNKKCSAIYDKETQSECSAYKEYLEGKKNDADQMVSELSNQIAAVKNDISKLNEVVEKNNEELESAQKVLESIKSAVVETNTSIEKLKVQIKEKEVSIKERDKQMRKRLIEMQPYIGSNNFIDFLMGASSFTDLLRRTSIIGELNSYEREQIEALNKEKQELNDKENDVSLKKELLVAQEKDAKIKAEKVAAIKDANEQLMDVYQKQSASLNAEKAKAQVASGQYAASIPNVDLSDIPDDWGNGDSSNNSNENSDNKGDTDNGSSDSGSGGNTDDGSSDNNGESNNNGDSDNGNSGGSTNPPLSNGWILPLQSGNFYYSAGTWAYANGAEHRGMDLGTYQLTGLPVVAPATGIVVAVNDSGYANHRYDVPPTPEEQVAGYPSGAGNGMHMIVNVDGICYGVSFYHLTTGSFTVGVGSVVEQGTMIARTGNAGNSWGPHLHFEITKLGKMSIKEGVQMWNNYNKDYFYGKYYVSTAKCEVTSVPCAVRPEQFFGY